MRWVKSAAAPIMSNFQQVPVIWSANARTLGGKEEQTCNAKGHADEERAIRESASVDVLGGRLRRGRASFSHQPPKLNGLWHSRERLPVKGPPKTPFRSALRDSLTDIGTMLLLPR